MLVKVHIEAISEPDYGCCSCNSTAALRFTIYPFEYNLENYFPVIEMDHEKVFEVFGEKVELVKPSYNARTSKQKEFNLKIEKFRDFVYVYKNIIQNKSKIKFLEEKIKYCMGKKSMAKKWLN